MYHKLPTHEVPQTNLLQRFFNQRLSAIFIEIAMTVVITLVAGSAFDFFDSPAEQATASAPPQQVVERSPAEIPLAPILARGIEYASQGRYAAAAAVFDLARQIGADNPAMYLEISQFYATLGYQEAAQASDATTQSRAGA